MRRILVLALAAWLGGAATRAAAGGFVLLPLQQPQSQGDQVIFYYDARTSFTTFLNVRSSDFSGSLAVRILFYSGSFSAPFLHDVTIPADGLRIIDVGALRSTGLPAAAGVAMAFAVNPSGQPIVTRALSGSFTVANLLTSSAWGAPGAARSAYTIAIVPVDDGADAVRDLGEATGGVIVPPVGTAINGNTTLLQPIAPLELDLAAYYNPNDLAPVASAGNQLIFVSFADVPGSSYTAQPRSVTWSVDAKRSNGSFISGGSFAASGVTVSDLASVAGSGVNGSAGSIRFAAPPVETENLTRLIYFAESLGTFGTGYLLPTRSVPRESAP